MSLPDEREPQDWQRRLQVLEDELFQNALSPNDMSLLPLVYGYIRTSCHSYNKLRRYQRQIATFCDREGYQLAGIFSDTATPSDMRLRPGLAGLLDVCGLPDTRGVVLPSPHHFSWDLTTFEVLARPLQRTGVRLHFIHTGVPVTEMEMPTTTPDTIGKEMGSPRNSGEPKEKPNGTTEDRSNRRPS
ncbi:recombinase family protein [Allokutzneria sp. A3M-2-11 16]|uniref:recombinase family protein n=1 Tax=Allokutzneria sp. A3M-2-11 16 TaxID=2962043 RepID=UPI0020B866E9|nr:recombinase family protein [Allokutzneria sp. A3M-2-11 16]MCP3797979.1 recombinase family protein [Allokutzneria sp. A3M-2-11 16]